MSHFYLPGPWPTLGNDITQDVVLDAKLSHHLRVRRIEVGETFAVFDGCGQTAWATLTSLDKKGAAVRLSEIAIDISTENKTPITLAQGMASSDKMDWLIEKAVEVGVARIIPLHTERSVVRLDGERAAKKGEHWQAVITAACEQCDRTMLPVLEAVHNLPLWLASHNPHDGQLRLILSPRAEMGLLSAVKKMPAQAITLLIGPEGGLSEAEEEQAKRAGFIPVSLGKRILRTETAALATITAIQTIWNQL